MEIRVLTMYIEQIIDFYTTGNAGIDYLYILGAVSDEYPGFCKCLK